MSSIYIKDLAMTIAKTIILIFGRANRNNINLINSLELFYSLTSLEINHKKSNICFPKDSSELASLTQVVGFNITHMLITYLVFLLSNGELQFRDYLALIDKEHSLLVH